MQGRPDRSVNREAGAALAVASTAALQRALPDARGGQVAFVSHCLLNQNTRYLGGAVCAGVVPAVVHQFIEDGTGVVQMPCPEQRVWGGVLKTRLLWLLRHRSAARTGPALARLGTWYLRRQYARLARAVVDDVADYLASGYGVVGVVGVAGSPSCGVRHTLDLRTALNAIATTSHAPISKRWMNHVVIEPALRDGRGLFMDALASELARRHLCVPMAEHTLVPTKAGAP